ncbi:hypothetical protein RND71_043391 [Anisodus tanguticus]|uniref:Lethal giant larvae homologue 2 domain-containing protein n=1 Tax=Anisodus tanguticus TaxID=243964 RepID=A0AAE1UM66_9SOLA|nr:hypothetical protein RND71_043391 [Anisodus tanguticus]
MMKFIRSRGAHVNAERLKLQKELFEYNQTIYHGFPHRPSALAYDKKLNLLAIGTKEGDLRILGKAGVEFQAILKNQKKIDSIVFIKNTSQLLVKCEDNSVYLYEIPNNLSSNVNSDELILIKSFYHFVTESENEEKPSNHITALMVNSTLNTLYIGTENGKIHFVNLKNFDVTENAISQEIINSKLPKDVAKNLGAPEIILEHPTNSDLILIGYNRGQLVLWNLTTSNCEKVFVSDQLLEHACWSSNGDEFMSSHHDGSYIIWSTNDNVEPSQQPKIVYGPYPCKPINKIYGKSSENLIIFSGGMTRQEHGDRHTVSVFQGVNDSTKHQTLDLTSKVIDFVVIEKDTEKALIILAEEELVAIDLNDPEWSQFKLPYLSSVHSSPITFSQIYSSVDGDLIKKLEKIGSNQKTGKYSNREWPIQGGFIKEKTYQADNTLLITGHENGSVRLWNLSDIAMNPLCTINTAKFFGTDDDIVPIDSDDQNYDADEWPPFKKVGVFDPYSDDPRLGIRKVVLCLKKFSLLIAGTSGQVLVFELKEEAAKYQLTREDIDLVTGLDFVWKSHECLSLESNMISFEPGYQPTSIIQLNPPASITALALNTDWNLFSAGTTHGFAIFNYETNKTISFKCTLNPAEVSNASSGNLITRKKSLRKTLRESFRKLRKGRSLRVTKKGDKSPVVSPSKSKGSKVDVSLDYRPVERQIEAKTEDGIGSVVRYLYFANAPIINQGQLEKTLWAGTNAGNIFIYLINDAQNPDVENSSVENKTASTIVPNNSTEEILEKKSSTEKICVNKNLVNAEVHYPQLNGNGYINESVATNGKKHINLYDDDEGEGKSIDEDLDKTEENLEKSNGTPTSGIIEDDDDDDSYSDANDLNTIDAKFGKYTETKNKDLVINETEKDNSVIDNSFNITIDSVKEHFNNLVISDSHDSHDFSFGAGGKFYLRV